MGKENKTPPLSENQKESLISTEQLVAQETLSEHTQAQLAQQELTYHEAARVLDKPVVEQQARSELAISTPTPSPVLASKDVAPLAEQIEERVTYEISDDAMDLPEVVDSEVAATAHTNEQLTDLADIVGQETPEPAEELLVQDQDSVIDDWSAELSKEPLEIYEDFTQALVEYALKYEETLDDTGQTVAYDEQAPEQQLASQIVERLAELDEDTKAQVAEVFKDITGAIHGLHLLEANAASPEAIEQTEAKLNQLLAELVEIIGIELSDEQMEQFVQIVLQLKPGELAPRIAETEILPLDKLGTHEAKLTARPLLDDTADSYMQRSLGMFTLICVGLNRGIQAS